MVWHPQLQGLNTELQAVGGFAIAGNDDGYAIGPPSVVFPAVARFREAIRETCGLNLRLSKSLIYTKSGVLPPEAPEGMERAGTQVEGEQ